MQSELTIPLSPPPVDEDGQKCDTKEGEEGGSTGHCWHHDSVKLHTLRTAHMRSRATNLMISIVNNQWSVDYFIIILLQWVSLHNPVLSWIFEISASTLILSTCSSTPTKPCDFQQWIVIRVILIIIVVCVCVCLWVFVHVCIYILWVFVCHICIYMYKWVFVCVCDPYIDLQGCSACMTCTAMPLDTLSVKLISPYTKAELPYNK